MHGGVFIELLNGNTVKHAYGEHAYCKLTPVVK